ncbi:hypothetical protein LGT39_04215 [Demequina sp. TTPB684]|uniref:hypothetical protein n=1 Tax=unclassified Demequina TaxID=2620311 RepID=UPI001CF155FF|nr:MULTISPECIES: hypothetical protein [unclassified Demequina]MCB2412052.1 hypothetical protein [Demequina sp. TTPB684]UPU88023.1 hypothetical protein LGT36_012345 [Demequina sp. TMPB413]
MSTKFDTAAVTAAASNEKESAAMGFEHRHQLLGMILGVAAFAAYSIVVVTRALTDDVSVTKVAWQGPMLLMVGVGGALYAVFYGLERWRLRGQIIADERDAEIMRRSESAGGGLTSLAALVTMIMLALGADAFWAVHVLFVGSFLGSLTQSGTTLAAYTEGLDR